MIKERIAYGIQEFSRWGAAHPNGRLAVIGAALYIVPMLLLVAALALVETVHFIAPDSFIDAALRVILYFGTIVVAGVLAAGQLSACVILPFAGWRAYRDYRNKKTGSARPRQ